MIRRDSYTTVVNRNQSAAACAENVRPSGDPGATDTTLLTVEWERIAVWVPRFLTSPVSWVSRFPRQERVPIEPRSCYVPDLCYSSSSGSPCARGCSCGGIFQYLPGVADSMHQSPVHAIRGSPSPEETKTVLVFFPTRPTKSMSTRMVNLCSTAVLRFDGLVPVKPDGRRQRPV